MSFLTVFIVAVAVAVPAHLIVRKPASASVLAGVLTSLLVLTFWTLRQGYFDGWFFISFFTLSALSTAIAFGVGLAIRAIWRRAR